MGQPPHRSHTPVPPTRRLVGAVTARLALVMLIAIAAAAACTSSNPRTDGEQPSDDQHATTSDHDTESDADTDTDTDTRADDDSSSPGDGDTAGDASADDDAGDGPTEPSDADLSDSGAGDGDTDGGDAADSPCDLGPSTSDYSRYLDLLACLRSSEPAADKSAAVDAFVAAVDAGAGFPIVTAQSVVFVYVRRAAYDEEDDCGTDEDFALDRRREPIRVTGNFNLWNATEQRLVNEGADFFHVEVTLGAATNERWEYKLIAKDGAGNDVWFSDPLSRRFQFDGFGRYAIIRGGMVTGVAAGHLEQWRHVHATKLGNDRRIYVWVPPGYEAQTSKRYPVLYMHDGNNVFDTAQPASNGTWDADAVATSEIAAGRIKEIIIIGVPNNANRFGEYTHTPDEIEWNGQVQMLGGDGADYADFIVHDLKPLVDARYRTLADKAHTAVLGSSLGGLISYYVGYLYPETFGLVGGMSSTFRWGDFGLGNPIMEDLYRAIDVATRQQVFYLDSGDNPENATNPPPCPTPDSESEDNYCETLSFRNMLEQEGVTHFPANADGFPLAADVDIYHYWVADAAHNEAAWSARLFRPLRLFFGPNRP